MQAYAVEIATNITYVNKQLSVAYEPIRKYGSDNAITIPNYESLPTDVQQWKRLSYLLAGVITRRFKLRHCDNNGILVYLWHYSSMRQKFAELEKAYKKRYDNMKIYTTEFQNLVLQDTAVLANKLEAYVQQTVTSEILKRNNVLVHMQCNYRGKGWVECRVNRYSVTIGKKPYNIHLYEGLECYRRMLQFHQYDSTQYRLLDKNNKPVEEAAIVEEWANEYWAEKKRGEQS